MGWQEQLAWPRLFLFLGLVFILLTASQPYLRQRFQNWRPTTSPEDSELSSWCELPNLPASIHEYIDPPDFFSSESLDLQVTRLSAAVNVSTVSYNDNGNVDEDPRYKTFDELHDVLKRLFPLVHERTELEKVNRYGLLYTLSGSDPDLKPIVFMSHQDVVPTGDESIWTHPPFSAFHDGTYLWGRGTVDCKNNLIGLLSVLEALLSTSFTPRRSIIFSFGFDEEVGGIQGGATLASHLETKYGRNSIAMILDEGGNGITAINDVTYIYPAIAEKGYMDITLTLTVPGGHSSRPPPHSGIGIMATLLTTLEAHPLSPRLEDSNPYHHVLECQTAYSAKDFEPWLPVRLRESNASALATALIDSRGDAVRWLMQTSQAITILHGGESDNTLPSSVRGVVNYRVLPGDRPEGILEDVATLLRDVAHGFNIAVTSPGFEDSGFGSDGTLIVELAEVLPASPIAPTGPQSEVWALFAGTLRVVYANTTAPGNSEAVAKTVVPVGTLMTANTDTVHYWGLSENIYRFSPRREGTFEGTHGVDERLDMRVHLEGMDVYWALIQNFDSWDGGRR